MAGERRGRGIAGSQAFSSYVAQVAEVTVAKSGAVKVDRIVLAIDCGRVVNPDIAAAQLEGGIIMGLTSALRGEITLADGRVQQSNFNNYKMLRISEVPKIEIYFLPSEEAPSGLGELGVLSVAPAVGNAIFMATGKRVRSLPFRTAELATVKSRADENRLCCDLWMGFKLEKGRRAGGLKHPPLLGCGGWHFGRTLFVGFWA